MQITITPIDSPLADVIREMATGFDRSGLLLHDGRNQVRQIEADGTAYVVKRYHKLGWLKGLIYTFLRKTKAQRAYENALTLQERGIATPTPIAFALTKRRGLTEWAYFISTPTDRQPIAPSLVGTPDFDKALAHAYACFVAELHEKGIVHHDLNPTNVLYSRDEKGYLFELIDINRMQFYTEHSIPKEVCMENLTRFWWLTPVYEYVLNAYAAARQWSDEDKERAIAVKKRHDRHWIRRKNFLSLLKHGHLKYKR